MTPAIRHPYLFTQRRLLCEPYFHLPAFVVGMALRAARRPRSFVLGDSLSGLTELPGNRGWWHCWQQRLHALDSITR